jgi:hypothetical protein
MAAATNEVERIVRKLLKEDRDDTLSAIQELSAILTEQVIPKLANRGDGDGDGDADWADESDAAEDEDTDQEGPISMSAFDDEGEAPSRRRKPGSTNGREDGDDVEVPEGEVPPAVMEAFSSLYHTLSSEQAAAFAELFTTIDGELDDEGNAEDDDQQEDTRVHA